MFGGPCGDRTHDTRIKSPVLCQTELTARACPAMNRRGMRHLIPVVDWRRYFITCESAGKTPVARNSDREVVCIATLAKRFPNRQTNGAFPTASM